MAHGQRGRGGCTGVCLGFMSRAFRCVVKGRCCACS
jgi:hypothetical protein